MRITSIGLLNFRNYETLVFNPPEGIVMITGRNAQGKTNLIEAICMCSVGRSHRTRKDKDLVRWGEKESQIRITTRHAHAPHAIRMWLSTGGPRRIDVNEQNIARAGDMIGYVNSVMFAPEDLKLIKEGPQERRRFMDMGLSQAAPSYFFSLQRYQKALRHRNALLRQIPSKPSLKALLDAWDEQMAEPAQQIHLTRAHFATKMADVSARIHAMISGSFEDLSVRYRSSPDSGEDGYKDAFLRGLFASRDNDIRLGVTCVGPHRDDIALLIGGRDARLYASQGQQRTAALSLKLSQVELLRESTGESPILLLDDVMSELDDARKEALLEWIGDVQTFITTADPGLSLPVGTSKYSVSDGHITKL